MASLSRQFAIVTAVQGAITTAISAAALGVTIANIESARYLTCQAVFTYGSGGTTAKFWVQTSLDGGGTWIDIMSFAFTTSTASKVSAVTITTALAAGVTPGSAALADNTILSGLIGDRIRVIGTTVGTYAGSTSIAISGVTKG